MQAFAFNLRRNKFKDPRVRLAFNYAFDFEEMNKKIFFGQYKRTASYFEGTELAATGLPTGRELELLETVRDKVPPEVFTKPYSNPVGGDPTAVRNNLREALRLFREAGYEVRNQQIVNAKTGEPFEVEFLTNAPLFERVFLFYKPSLERLGITVSVRTVDEAHYENRLRGWDFDVITFAWGESLLPGNEQRGYWGSQAADQSGSDNILGIKNPAVDEMITKIVSAKTRDDLVAATRALDRILLWNQYVVPQWGYAKLRTARWNRFSRPGSVAEIRHVSISSRCGGGTRTKQARRAAKDSTRCSRHDTCQSPGNGMSVDSGLAHCHFGFDEFLVVRRFEIKQCPARRKVFDEGHADHVSGANRQRRRGYRADRGSSDRHAFYHTGHS